VYELSQGCVERGNRYGPNKIAAMTHSDRHSRSSWRPRISQALNTVVHAATKDSPFRTMFGQDLRSDFVLGGFFVAEDLETDASEEVVVVPAVSVEGFNVSKSCKHILFNTAVTLDHDYAIQPGPCQAEFTVCSTVPLTIIAN